MRCKRCGLLHMGKAARCPVCRAILLPKKMPGAGKFKKAHRCFRCGGTTNALNTLCWRCESAARKALRIKPEWKKTYKKEMQYQGGEKIGKPRAPDKR